MQARPALGLRFLLQRGRGWSTEAGYRLSRAWSTSRGPLQEHWTASEPPSPNRLALAEHSPASSRSVLNRSWQLAAGTRVEPGTGTSNELLQETRQCLGSRGSSIQPSVGSTLGRDSSLKVAGGGRVHRSAAEVVAPHDHHEQGARRDSGRPGRATAQKASTKTAESRCIGSGRERRAPGSEAPSLSLPALWNSLPCRCSGAFALFLRSAHRLEPDRAPTPFTWPCPLPYPEASDGNNCGKSGWLILLWPVCPTSTWAAPLPAP